MAGAKTLVERISDVRASGSVAREQHILNVMDIYCEQFNKPRATIYFKNVPPNLVWKDNHSFTFSGSIGKATVFSPKTIADFVSVCESVGYTLFPQINMIDTDEFTIERNNRLKLLF